MGGWKWQDFCRGNLEIVVADLWDLNFWFSAREYSRRGGQRYAQDRLGKWVFIATRYFSHCLPFFLR